MPSGRCGMADAVAMGVEARVAVAMGVEKGDAMVAVGIAVAGIAVAAVAGIAAAAARAVVMAVATRRTRCRGAVARAAEAGFSAHPI